MPNAHVTITDSFPDWIDQALANHVGSKSNLFIFLRIASHITQKNLLHYTTRDRFKLVPRGSIFVEYSFANNGPHPITDSTTASFSNQLSWHTYPLIMTISYIIDLAKHKIKNKKNIFRVLFFFAVLLILYECIQFFKLYFDRNILISRSPYYNMRICNIMW